MQSKQVPADLKDYVRTLVHTHLPELKRNILAAIIRPRVRRLVQSMHASHESHACTAPTTVETPSTASSLSGQEQEDLAEQVCIMLCEHACNVDSLLALRTVCAEELPTVVQATVEYLAELKDFTDQDTLASNPQPLKTADAPADISSPPQSAQHAKIPQTLSWRSSNVANNCSKNPKSSIKPLTADSKPWRPKSMPTKPPHSSAEAASPSLHPTLAHTSEGYTAGPILPKYTQPPDMFCPASMHAAHDHAQSSSAPFAHPMPASGAPQMPMSMYGHCMMPFPFMCSADETPPVMPGSMMGIEREPLGGNLNFPAATALPFMSSAPFTSPSMVEKHLQSSHEPHKELCTSKASQQTPEKKINTPRKRTSKSNSTADDPSDSKPRSQGPAG
jgi:hypothetical protein